MQYFVLVTLMGLALAARTDLDQLIPKLTSSSFGTSLQQILLIELDGDPQVESLVATFKEIADQLQSGASNVIEQKCAADSMQEEILALQQKKLSSEADLVKLGSLMETLNMNLEQLEEFQQIYVQQRLIIQEQREQELANYEERLEEFELTYGQVTQAKQLFMKKSIQGSSMNRALVEKLSLSFTQMSEQATKVTLGTMLTLLSSVHTRFLEEPSMEAFEEYTKYLTDRIIGIYEGILQRMDGYIQGLRDEEELNAGDAQQLLAMIEDHALKVDEDLANVKVQLDTFENRKNLLQRQLDESTEALERRTQHLKIVEEQCFQDREDIQKQDRQRSEELSNVNLLIQLIETDLSQLQDYYRRRGKLRN